MDIFFTYSQSPSKKITTQTYPNPDLHFPYFIVTCGKFLEAESLVPEFSVTGLCNVAWAFVRFGLPVPSSLARLIAEASNGDGNGGCMCPMFFGSGTWIKLLKETIIHFLIVDCMMATPKIAFLVPPTIWSISTSQHSRHMIFYKTWLAFMSERSDGPIRSVSLQLQRCCFLPSMDGFGAQFFSRRRFNAVMRSLENRAMRCYCRMLCAASTTAGLFGGGEAMGGQEWVMTVMRIEIWLVQSAPSWSQLSHSPSQTLDISTIRSCPRHLYVRTEVASTCPCSALRPLWCHWKAGQINVLSAKGGPYFYPNAKPWLQFNSMSILLKVIWPQPKPPTSPWPSPQLPSSRCLAKGALWRSLGFLGGLVQRSSVGLQPSWGRYLPSTSDLAHGNGVVAATTCSHGGWTQSQCRQQPEAQESRQPKD